MRTSKTKIKKQPKKKKKHRIHKVILFFASSFIAGFFLLEVNFSPQAPEKNWSQPWLDACEETSIVIIDSFYNKRELGAETAKRQILDIFSLKEKAFGPSLDEDAKKITYLINNFLVWESWIVENPTTEQMKEQLKNNGPIILPADAKKLSNKYINASGYHVFVLSGYDDDKKSFISQEPGTQFGKNYRYSYKTIEKAMQDYNINGLNEGKKIAIFTSQRVEVSSESDGDEDGLKKIDELRIKTSLTSADTDGNGYTDAIEKNNQFQLASSSKKNDMEGKLIHLAWDYRVYLIQNNKKRHLANGDILNKMGRDQKEITIIDARSFNSIATGNPITSWPEAN